MKIHNLLKEEVLQNLVTSEGGLSEEEAVKRLTENGFNEIREIKKTSLPVRFFRQFTHFLAILLWIGASLCFLSEYLHPGGGMITLGLAIIGVIIINAVFTFIQEYRAEKALDALKKLLPFYVRVLRGNSEKEIPSREVVSGDVILISEGDRIPADARLIASSLLKVNNAPLTGESEPVSRDEAASIEELLNSSNIVFAGTTVISGSGRAVVFATGMSTEVGRIAHLTSVVEPGLSPLQKEISRTTRIIAVLASVVGLIFFAVGHIIGRVFWENFIFAIGVIVALVPEGMLPTVTLSLAMASQRMARKKALIKNLSSVETLGCVTVICTDKTGTLTLNRMAVSKIWKDNRITEVNDYRPVAGDKLMQAAFFCNNARCIDDEYKGDPTETALLKVAGMCRGDSTAERICEVPFDSERKRMTTLNRVDGREYVFTKGAMESILPLCSRYSENGNKQEMDENFRNNVTDACYKLMDMGLRVLAFAYRDFTEPGAGERQQASQLERELVFAGMIALEDPPRPEIQEALKKCHSAGIRVIMITGDGSRTAVAIAREIGLVKGSPVVVDGAEFVKMNDSDLREKLLAKEIIFARMTPKHKMRVVSILKEEGERVAVTGDGVNDAPALKKADIGIAMGISGTDVAKEASDMILLDDNFATIINAVEEGRAVFENIRKFIAYFFTSNVAELAPYIIFVIFRVPLPLTIMQVLVIDLGTDLIPGLALGAEKPTKEVMSLPPRSPEEKLLNTGILSLVFLFLGVIEASAGLFGFFHTLIQGGWHWGEMVLSNDILYIQATTACLTGIVLAQVANVFACRSFRESVFSIGFFSNRLIFAGIAFELALQLFIVYHPWGNRIFSTAPIQLHIWLVLLPFAFVLFFAEEMRKKVAGYRQPDLLRHHK